MPLLPDWKSPSAISRFATRLQWLSFVLIALTTLVSFVRGLQWLSSILGVLTTFVTGAVLRYETRKDQLADEQLKLKTAKAHERTTALERNSEKTRLEHEELKKQVRRRELTIEMKQKLLAVIKTNTHNVKVTYISNDAEALSFAEQLLSVFREAGWQTIKEQATFDGSVTGVKIPQPTTEATILVRKAFGVADIQFDPSSNLPHASQTYSTGANRFDTRVVVGSKP